MNVYKEPLEQIKEFYLKRGLLKVINGEGTIKEIVDEMDTFIQSRI
jgi:adenylate kinase